MFCPSPSFINLHCLAWSWAGLVLGPVWSRSVVPGPWSLVLVPGPGSMVPWSLVPGPWPMVCGPWSRAVVPGPWPMVRGPGPWPMVPEVHPRHGFFTNRLHMGAMEVFGPPSDAEFQSASF